MVSKLFSRVVIGWYYIDCLLIGRSLFDSSKTEVLVLQAGINLVTWHHGLLARTIASLNVLGFMSDAAFIKRITWRSATFFWVKDFSENYFVPVQAGTKDEILFRKTINRKNFWPDPWIRESRNIKYNKRKTGKITRKELTFFLVFGCLYLVTPTVNPNSYSLNMPFVNNN